MTNRRVKRLARIRYANAKRAEADLRTDESIARVMSSLWWYRFRKGAMSWCLIIATIPLFLLIGMCSPIGPGVTVVVAEFAYWPQFLSVMIGGYFLAYLFNRGLR